MKTMYILFFYFYLRVVEILYFWFFYEAIVSNVLCKRDKTHGFVDWIHILRIDKRESILIIKKSSKKKKIINERWIVNFSNDHASNQQTKVIVANN